MPFASPRFAGEADLEGNEVNKPETWKCPSQARHLGRVLSPLYGPLLGQERGVYSVPSMVPSWIRNGACTQSPLWSPPGSGTGRVLSPLYGPLLGQEWGVLGQEWGVYSVPSMVHSWVRNGACTQSSPLVGA